MIAEYICKGLLIGLIFGVPAGAIGALTIGRTLEKGFAAGFLTGMGSSAADLIYSYVGVFGITVVSDVLSAGQSILQATCGILILLLGFGILCQKKTAAVQKESKGSLAFCFLSAFTTALVNPMTVLSFMAAFAAFGIRGGLDAGQGTALITGIFIGTLCWWLALSGITAHFRNRVTEKIYRWLNWILGCLMIGFGIITAAQGLRSTGLAEVSGGMETGEFMSVQENTEQIQNEQMIPSEPVDENSLETEEMNIWMKVDDEAVAVEWEENDSVRALMELLREQPISIQMSMYGGFEQVGSLGTSLQRSDEQTTTQAGDIVLYSGSQIVVFYGSNSWAYTRLGRITDKSTEELAELLGNGDVTITLELK